MLKILVIKKVTFRINKCRIREEILTSLVYKSGMQKKILVTCNVPKSKVHYLGKSEKVLAFNFFI